LRAVVHASVAADAVVGLPLRLHRTSVAHQECPAGPPVAGILGRGRHIAFVDALVVMQQDARNVQSVSGTPTTPPTEAPTASMSPGCRADAPYRSCRSARSARPAAIPQSGRPTTPRWPPGVVLSASRPHGRAPSTTGRPAAVP